MSLSEKGKKGKKLLILRCATNLSAARPATLVKYNLMLVRLLVLSSHALECGPPLSARRWRWREDQLPVGQFTLESGISLWAGSPLAGGGILLAEKRAPQLLRRFMSRIKVQKGKVFRYS
jgi:hypothetical protein